MYTAYFGLRQPPFSIAPDPRYLYMSQRHREALAHLVYGVQAGGGFVLLTGDIGSGKTTICRSLLQQTPATVRLAYVVNPKLDAVELLQTICEELRIPLPDGPPSVKALIAPLNRFLLQTHAAGERCVLIIDEAQNLSADVLEQLRLLTNLETHEHKLLQIILIGQPELRDMLARPELEQLAQRVIARYHLQALDEADTRHYVQHRMTVAGLQGPLPFDRRALQRIHRLSRGVPRRINLLCDRALLGAYARRLRQVNARLVDLAATEALGTRPVSPWRGAAIGTVIVAGAVAGLVILWHRAPAPVNAGANAAAAPLPTRTHTPAPPASVPAPPSAPPPRADVPTLTSLAPLPDQQNPLWQSLGRRWGLTLPEKDICEAALRQGVQCFRTSDLTSAGLRQLDRPGLLLLQHQGLSRWVIVERLDGDRLRLDAGGQRWQLPLNELPHWWQGDYASLWRLPPGQTQRLYAASEQDPAGRWLDAYLRSQAPATGSGSATSFAERVRAFQQQHQLPGDGKALPSTFLLAYRLAGVDEPRLQTVAR